MCNLLYYTCRHVDLNYVEFSASSDLEDNFPSGEISYINIEVLCLTYSPIFPLPLVLPVLTWCHV